MAPIRSTVGVAQQVNVHVGIAAGRDWLGRLLVVHCGRGDALLQQRFHAGGQAEVVWGGMMFFPVEILCIA